MRRRSFAIYLITVIGKLPVMPLDAAVMSAVPDAPLGAFTRPLLFTVRTAALLLDQVTEVAVVVDPSVCVIVAESCALSPALIRIGPATFSETAVGSTGEVGVVGVVGADGAEGFEPDDPLVQAQATTATKKIRAHFTRMIPTGPNCSGPSQCIAIWWLNPANEERAFSDWRALPENLTLNSSDTTPS